VCGVADLVRPVRATREQPQPLPTGAKRYVWVVIATGTLVLLLRFPHGIPNLPLFAVLFALAQFTSAFKVSLPLSKSGATMSVSYVADFMAVMLVGPDLTMIMAGIGAWAQCTFNRRRRTGLLRTLFSIATLVLTVQATGLAFLWLGGQPGRFNTFTIVRPLVAGAMVYFLVNTVLVAGAIALTTNQSPRRVWHDTFLWSAPSYFVGAGVSVLAAWLINTEGVWFTPLAAAPVWLTYRTYKVYLGRIEDERRHVQEISGLHDQAMEALAMARQSQRELAAEKERLTVTLKSLGEAVITTDLHGRILLLNHTAEVFAGCSQEQVIGKSLSAVFKLIDASTAAASESPVDAILRPHRTAEAHNRATLVSRDGTQRLVEHTGMPIRNNDGAVEGVVVVVRDVSDVARLEEERQKAGKLASLGVLAGGIAHDFNNILTAIVGNISLARLDASLDFQTDGQLGEAEKACARAKTLTHQLLTFSKGGTPVKKTVGLNDIIRESAGFALRGTNVRCDFVLADNLWAVEADEGQMVQVLNNLVLNAQQAMAGGGTIVITSQNQAADAGRDPRSPQVRISVEDRGVGIPEEHLNRIFDPYFTTKRQGSGLGLATSYSIVRNHGGSIDVRSIVNQGTVITITLPAHPERVPVRREARSVAKPGKGRVLVMDDEEALRNLARAMLGKLGYEVAVAADGREAIEMYRSAKEANRTFDVVVMDLTVPGGIGGKDAIQDLLRIDPDVRAIVSSGYADDPVMAEYEAYGFKGVVPKPFGSGELSTALQQVLCETPGLQLTA
jgi:PAS domain S-box-containing protein